MDLPMKILFGCVVFCATLYCSAIENYNLEIESCVVQYLKQKGKLNESLQSTIPPTSRCRLLVPTYVQNAKSVYRNHIADTFPANVAECLAHELDNAENFDYYLKWDLIELSSLFGDSEKISQLQETRKLLKDVRREADAQCGKRFEIFNKTLEEYCMAKYTIDNQLLELNNVDINPYEIDTGSVNCDNIVDTERRKYEKEYSDEISATETGRRLLDCIMKEYRNGNMAGCKIALKILHFSGMSIQVQKGEVNRINKKIEGFISKSVACNITMP